MAVHHQSYSIGSLPYLLFRVREWLGSLNWLRVSVTPRLTDTCSHRSWAGIMDSHDASFDHLLKLRSSSNLNTFQQVIAFHIPYNRPFISSRIFMSATQPLPFDNLAAGTDSTGHLFFCFTDILSTPLLSLTGIFRWLRPPSCSIGSSQITFTSS